MCIHPQIHSWQNNIHINIQKISVTITVLLIVAGHVVTAGVCNYLILLLILDFLCPQEAPQLVMVLYLMGDPNLHSWASGPGLGCVGFQQPWSQDMITPRPPEGSPVFHILPYSIWNSNPVSPCWSASMTLANMEVPARPVSSEVWWARSGSMIVLTSSSIGSVLFLVVEAFLPLEPRHLCLHSLKLWEQEAKTL